MVVVGALAVAACLVVAAFGGTGSRAEAADAGPGTTSADGVQHLHFEYGPLDIRPGQNVIDTNKYLIPQPNEDGWIVGFKPNLRLGERQGAAGRRDPPAPRRVGERAAAATRPRRCSPSGSSRAGEEKTALELPKGYGYPYRTSDCWYLNYMIHDLTPKPFTVYLTYDVDFVATKDAPRVA